MPKSQQVQLVILLWATSAYVLRLCINPRNVMQYISSIHLMHVNVQESMRKSCRHKSCNPYQVLQIILCLNVK